MKDEVNEANKNNSNNEGKINRAADRTRVWPVKV